MLAAWQQHTYAEFALKDVDAALATMTENPYVLLIPAGTGASLWDQATVLAQLGVLDHPLAAAGVGSAAQLLKLR
jgi:hypothetical protein